MSDSLFLHYLWDACSCCSWNKLVSLCSHTFIYDKTCWNWQMGSHLGRDFKYSAQSGRAATKPRKQWLGKTKLADFPQFSGGAKWNSPVSVLRFLQTLNQVTRLQRKVSRFTRLIGQLHLEMTTIKRKRKKWLSQTVHFGVAFWIWFQVGQMHWLTKPHTNKQFLTIAFAC